MDRQKQINKVAVSILLGFFSLILIVRFPVIILFAIVGGLGYALYKLIK